MKTLFRTPAQKISHDASNALYRGEVADFREAMRLIVAGMTAEREDSEAYNATLKQGDGQPEDTTIYVQFGMAASTALQLYRQEVDAAESRVVAGLRALAAQGGPAAADFANIADALESGEYSRLAW